MAAWSRAPISRRLSSSQATPQKSSAPAEVIASERMVKEQQMRWTPRGAHLLLQVRTHVLNDQLAGDFRR